MNVERVLPVSSKALSFGDDTSAIIKRRWEEKLDEGYVSYDPDRESRTKRLDIYTVKYLPGRLRYLTDNPYIEEMRVDTPHSAHDGFCVLWDDIEKKQKINELVIHNYTWRIVANSSPIERYHCVLIPNKARNQTLTLQYLEDLTRLARSNTGITLGFNSLRAGASQNHFHVHLFFSRWSRKTINQMPIQRSVFGLGDIKTVITFTDQLVKNNIGHNITISRNGLVVTKRRCEHVGGIRYGVDAVSGRFVMACLEQYDAITVASINEIINRITFKK